MSLEKIVAEAMAGRPLEMKEAFEEEIQGRIQEALEAKYMEMAEGVEEELDEEVEEDLEESKDEDGDEAELLEQTMTVDIDHTGQHDPHAKKHGITLKKTKATDYSHDATGKKKDLQKYLAKHYGSHEDAKDSHPEVYKESAG